MADKHADTQTDTRTHILDELHYIEIEKKCTNRDGGRDGGRYREREMERDRKRDR